MISWQAVSRGRASWDWAVKEPSDCLTDVAIDGDQFLLSVCRWMAHYSPTGPPAPTHTWRMESRNDLAKKTNDPR